MRVLYDMIHARSAKNWHQPVNRENFKLYADHWCNCARALKEEFEAEGLFETAAAFQKIADEQSRLNA